MRCVFRDALLHTIVVMHVFLRNCHLPVSFNQPGPSPLTSLINKAFLRTKLLLSGCFILHHYLQTLETVVCENPRRSAVTQTTLSGTNNHTSITFIPHSEIWSEKQLNLLTMSACFYAFNC